MITGTVTAQREARLHLALLGPDRHEQRVDVVIDTGFNGALTLPRTLISVLRLPAVGARWVTLGDGSTAKLDLYQARLRWHDDDRTVLVLQADGAPLLGMALLHGSRVTLDVIDGGEVAIEPLA